MASADSPSHSGTHPHVAVPSLDAQATSSSRRRPSHGSHNEQQQPPQPQQQQQEQEEEEEDNDADAVLAELEAEDSNPALVARAQQLASELGGVKRPGAGAGSLRPAVMQGDRERGGCALFKSDDEVLRFTTETHRCLLHFFHPDFRRCAVMDVHLAALADAHGKVGGRETRGVGSEGEEEVGFGRVDARDAAFVVEKLGVRVLPVLVGFVGGEVKGRIVGFDGVYWGGRAGEEGKEVTKEIERVAVGWGVLGRRRLAELEKIGDGGSESEQEGEEEDRFTKRDKRRGIKDRKPIVDDDDDDWD